MEEKIIKIPREIGWEFIDKIIALSTMFICVFYYAAAMSVLQI